MKTREEFEKLLNNSPVFSIDRDVDNELFIAEERKFITVLAKYLRIIRSDFDKIGYEIVVTAKSCIKSYSNEKGLFLNYFYSALDQNLLRIKAKELIMNKRAGIKLDRKTDSLIRKIINYAESGNEDINSSKFVDKIARILGISSETAVVAIKANHITNIKYSNYDDDDSDNDVFKSLKSSIFNPEEDFLKEEAIKEILKTMDIVFNEQQERTKPLLSGLLTVDVIKALNDLNLLEKTVAEISFIDKEIISRYKADFTIPKALEIAKKHGVIDASASRTLREFRKKVYNKMKEYKGD